MSDVLADFVGQVRFAWEPWREQAACRGRNLRYFFAERGEATEFAKDICRGCPVAVDCLTWALDNFEKNGIYGGTSERERRQMRRERRAAQRRGETYVVSPPNYQPPPHRRPVLGLTAEHVPRPLFPPLTRRPTRQAASGFTELLQATA